MIIPATIDAGRLLYMLLFLSSRFLISLRSEMISVVLANLFRVKIPPNFFAHSVNLAAIQLPLNSPKSVVSPALTGNVHQRREFDARFPTAVLYAVLLLSITRFLLKIYIFDFARAYQAAVYDPFCRY